jgi:hypothetical protein
MNDYLAERELWWPVSSELMASYHDIDKPARIYADGELQWLKNDKLHRDGDKPARICEDGTLVWYKNGKIHRDGDKPARIYADGKLQWWTNGKRHRDGDKPAWICATGTLSWLKNDLWHRTTGPAVIYPNYKPEYWVNDIEITSEVESWLKTRQYTYPFTPEQQVEFTLTFG